MSTEHTRNWIVWRKTSNGPWKFHKSYLLRTEAWNTAKAMKAEGHYDTKTLKRGVAA